jgi:hypothetical protein
VLGSWRIWTGVPSTYVGWEAVDLCTVTYEAVSAVRLHSCLDRTRQRFPVLTRKAYRFAISVKTGMSEKGAMVEALREYTSSAPHFDVPLEGGETTMALPPLRYVDEQDGWTTFEGPILYMYAGKGPFVSR